MVEILRGARSREDYERLRRHLEGATFLGTSRASWLRASELLLHLKLRGEVIPLADAIIAGQALQEGHVVFSTDGHFERVDGLELYQWHNN
jgi:predicted nucleic acid-binding protein